MCHYSPPKSDRRAGFTLIEVLVVVSIIALLISILLPSLARARDQARAAVCLSNLRQMGIGTVSYANSYREYIPPVDPAQPDVGPKDTSSGSWGSYQVGLDDMRVYHPKWVPNLKLWECPGARNRVSKHDDLRGTYAQDDSIRLGTAYEYNPWMYDIVSRPTSWPQFVMASKPQFRMLRMDVKAAGAVTIAHDNDNSSSAGAKNWYPDGDDPHAKMGGGHMLYADGHANWIWAKRWAKETDGGRKVVRR